MTPIWITLQGGTPEPDERAAPAAARPGRGGTLFVTAALLLSLIVIAMLIAFVFEPLANAAGGVLALAARPAAARPPGFTAVYLTSLPFGLPAFVFASPYAAVGGMTVAHGLQYLLLISLIASRPTSTAAAQARSSRMVRLALLANIALIGGMLLSTASHLHNSSPAGRLIFGAYLGVVMAHFVIDAGIWRMRDPLARKFVTESVPFLIPAPAVR